MSRQDYGTGYYVRSTAHPVVPDSGMTFDETIEALNSLDAVYNTADRSDYAHDAPGSVGEAHDAIREVK